MDKLKPLIFSFSLKNPAPGRGFLAHSMSACVSLPVSSMLTVAAAGMGYKAHAPHYGGVMPAVWSVE